MFVWQDQDWANDVERYRTNDLREMGMAGKTI
jgi:hypothetical protein